MPLAQHHGRLGTRVDNHRLHGAVHLERINGRVRGLLSECLTDLMSLCLRLSERLCGALFRVGERNLQVVHSMARSCSLMRRRRVGYGCRDHVARRYLIGGSARSMRL